MDSLNMGVILLDKDGIIRMCNRRAEEITGISISAGESHPAGKIEDGDIVIIADSKMGEDDGNLSAEDLKMLNIKDGEIREGDVIIAMGVYKNEKVRPIYKAMREHQLSTPMTVEAVYYGFRIFVSVDTVKHETLISVNDKKYRMGYFSAVGNMVVIDGATGENAVMDICFPDFLAVKDGPHSGLKPLRTYTGPRYAGGISDHLPIVLKIPL